MTRASAFLSKIYEGNLADAGVALSDPGLTTPQDVASTNTPALDIPDIKVIGDAIEEIINGMSDIPDDVTELVARYLDPVDPSGDCEIAQAVSLLSLADAQDFYDDLTFWCDKNGIDYTDADSSGITPGDEVGAGVDGSASTM